MDFQINDQFYKAGKLDAFKQLHLARRLAPLVVSVGRDLLRGGNKDLVLARIKEDPMGFAAPILEEFGKLSDDEINYIVMTCLAVVQRQQAPNMPWANVVNSVGGLQFEDIGMPEMLQITWKVLESNVGGFSGALQGLFSNEQAAGQ